MDQVSDSLGPDDAPGAVLPDTLSKVVGPEGGELRVRGVRLRVPAGALQEKTLLTVANLGDEAQTRLAPLEPSARFLARPTSFSPHGLQFLKAAEISIDVDDESASSVEIRRLDDEMDPTWTLIQGVPIDEEVSFDTRSFSVYALTSAALATGGAPSGSGGAASGGNLNGSGGKAASGGAPIGTGGRGPAGSGGENSSLGGAGEGGVSDGVAGDPAD